jgi:hypothetical protein
VDSLAQAQRSSGTAATADSTANDTTRAAVAATGPVVTDPAGQLQALQLPIGWSPNPYILGKNASGWDQFWALIVGIFGLLATTFAVSLGAPFWFDMLNRVMVIRATVKPHEKSPEEASEDRQRPRPTPGSAGGEPPPDNGGDRRDGNNGGGGGGGGSGGGGGGQQQQPLPGQALPPQQQQQPAPADDGPGNDYQPHEWAEGDAQKGVL